MLNYVMLMMGSASKGDWEAYIEKLISSSEFRGGSSLGKGVAMSKGQRDSECSVTGYVRFAVDNLDKAKELVSGNPLYEAGGRVELLEEIPD